MYIFDTYLDIDKLKRMRITILVKYINFPLPFPSSLNDGKKLFVAKYWL